MANEDAVIRDVTVRVGPDRAFAAFVDELDAWWPAAFTFAGDDLAAVLVEGGPDGRVYERPGDGAEADWGEIRAWDPPRRIEFAWRVAPDRSQEPPERASRVEVRFDAADDGTHVRLRHDDLGRHGDGAEVMRAGMASAQGWEGLLSAYRRHAEGPG